MIFRSIKNNKSLSLNEFSHSIILENKSSATCEPTHLAPSSFSFSHVMNKTKRERGQNDVLAVPNPTLLYCIFDLFVFVFSLSSA